MEKKVLLLGMLRLQDMHGYQLNELLTARAATAVSLSKANAYKLLKKMAVDGWVTSYEEQAGNRPTRRVYTLTPAGEAAFQRLLRASLRDYTPAEFPGVVALNFLDELPPHEAHALLAQRRAKVAAHFQELDDLPADAHDNHLSVAYLHRHYAAELAWLDDLMARLQP